MLSRGARLGALSFYCQAYSKFSQNYKRRRDRNSTEGYNKINNWPLNFLRTGMYTRSIGATMNRGWNGNYWSGVPASNINGYSAMTTPTEVNAQFNDYYRGSGFAVRCVGVIY